MNSLQEPLVCRESRLILRHFSAAPTRYTSGSTGALEFCCPRGRRCLDHWPGSGIPTRGIEMDFSEDLAKNRSHSTGNRTGSLTSYAQTAKVLAPSSEIGHRRQARKLPVSVDYEWPLFCKHSNRFRSRAVCAQHPWHDETEFRSDISASRIRSLKR